MVHATEFVQAAILFMLASPPINSPVVYTVEMAETNTVTVMAGGAASPVHANPSEVIGWLVAVETRADGVEVHTLARQRAMTPRGWTYWDLYAVPVVIVPATAELAPVHALADVNGDGFVNGDDMDDFMAAFGGAGS